MTPTLTSDAINMTGGAMMSQKSNAVPSPEHLSDEGHAFLSYVNIQKDTPGSNNFFFCDTLIIAPLRRVRDAVPTGMTQCSSERLTVAGIAMSTLVLGLLLGFLTMYFVWASASTIDLSFNPTCGPDIPCPTCRSDIPCPTCGPDIPCPTCRLDIPCTTCRPEIPCRLGFAQSPQVSKCYRFVMIRLKWEEARDHCRAEGGVLLELTNLADLNGFITLARQDAAHMEGAYAHFWTGGLRVEPNVPGSQFRWDASGEALPRDSPLWAEVEPNYYRGAPENYVELLIQEDEEYRGLNDVYQRESYSICESPPLV